MMIQLEFDGRCRQAFEYYAEVLEGEIKVMNSLDWGRINSYADTAGEHGDR